MKLNYSGHTIDIGNTMTTVHFFENGVIKKEWKIETHDIINNHNIISKIECLNKFSCTYCSVSPNAENSLINYSNAYKIKLHNLNSKALSRIKTSYPSPTEIGHDRISNVIAATSIKKIPCIVIDMGTATTFDIITQENGYEGGIIVPGAQGFLDYLGNNTALLPNLKLKNYKHQNMVGKSTQQAIMIGTLKGYPAMISSLVDLLLQEINNRIKQAASIILTGGNNEILDNQSFEKVPNLTSLGLAYSFQLNLAESISK